jgi:molybdopterin converting factor small subunit
LIILDGKEISALQGLETEVKDYDEIVLVPMVHGG